MYLSRVVEAAQLTTPNAKIPTVELPAATPSSDAALAAVAEALTQLEYVYLSRDFKVEQEASPKANIPTVELPAAAPPWDAAQPLFLKNLHNQNRCIYHGSLN